MTTTVQHLSINTQLLDRIKASAQPDTEAYLQAETAFKARHAEVDFDALDELRRIEYARLDKYGHIYLDYTGGGLYAESQLQAHMQLLSNGVYGNPHSSNPTSLAMTALDEQARSFVLEYFNADPDEYCVIFTQNASGALRLVGESYPFEEHGRFLLTVDNHNSVNGIREYAKNAGAHVMYTPLSLSDMRLDTETLLVNLERAIPGGNNLFAYPAQSNFTGVQHSLEWIEVARGKGWDVLVDCAAFAPSNRLDLSVVKPDYVPLSFYKIFGYPTGVGTLIARRSALSKLRRRWFAGGTIEVVSAVGSMHVMADGVAAFEDGTIDYLSLPAIEVGLNHIQHVGIDKIHQRVLSLTEFLLDQLTALKHGNDQPLVQIYGPRNTEDRGGTIACNFYDPGCTVFDYRLIEAAANEVNISVRAGCFCNPGAGETAFNLTADDIQTGFSAQDLVTFETYAAALIGQGITETVGAVRISVGVATTFRDVYQFVQFAKSFCDAESEGMELES